MPLISRTLLEALSIACLLSVIDIFVAFILVLFNPNILVLSTAGSYLILEFGIFLILGSCMMSRSPLDDEKRYDSDGKPSLAWKWAQRGKMFLVSSVFILLIGVFLSIIDFLT